MAKMKGLDELLKKYNIDNADEFETELNKLLPVDWIPKTVFNEESDKRKMSEKQMKEMSDQLTALQEKANLSEEQKKQIEQLTASHAREKAEWEQTLKATRQGYALDAALANYKVRNGKAVKALIDHSKLAYADDGKIEGLEEQMKALQESDSYLFNLEEGQQPRPKFGSPSNYKGGTGNDDSFIAQMREAAGLGDQK